MQGGPRGYIAGAETTSNLYGRPAMFGGMSDWSLDYHQALEFRLLGIMLLLGVSAMLGALACAIRSAGKRLLRHMPHGTPSCQRQMP
jgi:hypothetical protein